MQAQKPQETATWPQFLQSDKRPNYVGYVTTTHLSQGFL